MKARAGQVRIVLAVLRRLRDSCQFCHSFQVPPTITVSPWPFNTAMNLNAISNSPGSENSFRYRPNDNPSPSCR
jgi:hypothetical protein